MKRLFFIIIGIMCVTMFQCVTLAADNTEYIVKLKNESYFSARDINYNLKPLVPQLGLYTVENINDFDEELFEFVEEDAPVELFDTYDYNNFVNQYQFSITGIKNMWDIGAYGKNVRVGVIDSGCNPHLALKNNLLSGVNFAIDNNDTADTNDNIGHGTAVCGIIASEYDFGNVIGTAHKTNIIPLKFIDVDSEGKIVGGTTQKLTQAIISAVDDFQCNVINMSCGTINSNSLKIAVDYAVSKGVVIVAAVGNDSNSKLNYPAAYSNVIGVGSVNSQKNHSSFSNINESVFITAPGENINLLAGIDSVTKNSGTSFSAPYVSGIIADIKEINPEISTESIIRIISETAEDLGDAGYDKTFGYGLIRADAIIEYMLNECECFVTGIDECSVDGLSEIRVRFNKDKKDVYFAEYINGILNQIFIGSEYIGDNTVILRLQHTDGGMLRYFVWDNMKPIELNSNIVK